MLGGRGIAPVLGGRGIAPVLGGQGIAPVLGGPAPSWGDAVGVAVRGRNWLELESGAFCEDVRGRKCCVVSLKGRDEVAVARGRNCCVVSLIFSAAAAERGRSCWVVSEVSEVG